MKETKNWKNEFGNYLKKTLFFYLIGSLIISLFLIFIFSSAPTKLKNLLAKSLGPFNFESNLPLPFTQIKSDFQSFLQSAKTKLDSLKNTKEDLKEKIEAIKQKINEIKQDIERKKDKIFAGAEILENVYLQTKIKEPIYIFIKKENFNEVIVDWGDGTKTNLQLENDITLNHQWKESGIFQVLVELKNEKKSKKYYFFVKINNF